MTQFRASKALEKQIERLKQSNNDSKIKESNTEREKQRRDKLENDSLEQDNRQRKLYAALTFSLVSAYIATVFVILFMCGLKMIYLSDKILMILLGTSLAQIIGLFTFVMKYLFPNGKTKQSTSKG
jgi:Flp pilus assembly protein TadB